MYSLVSIGIASAGLLVAMMFNFGLLKGLLGFFVACPLFVAAAIMEVVFYISVKSSVNMEDVAEEMLTETKGYILKLT